jgi:single-strand DNA-binding protein
MINQISLVGRLGQEPETRYFESGAIKTTISLGVKQGKDRTDWIKVEFWGQVAETVANYLTKGCQIHIQGRLEIDNWADKQTQQPRTAPKVVVNSNKNLIMLTRPSLEAVPV